MEKYEQLYQISTNNSTFFLSQKVQNKDFQNVKLNSFLFPNVIYDILHDFTITIKYDVLNIETTIITQEEIVIPFFNETNINFNQILNYLQQKLDDFQTGLFVVQQYRPEFITNKIEIKLLQQAGFQKSFTDFIVSNELYLYLFGYIQVEDQRLLSKEICTFQQKIYYLTCSLFYDILNDNDQNNICLQFQLNNTYKFQYFEYKNMNNIHFSTNKTNEVIFKILDQEYNEIILPDNIFYYCEIELFNLDQEQQTDLILQQLLDINDQMLKLQIKQYRNKEDEEIQKKKDQLLEYLEQTL